MIQVFCTCNCLCAKFQQLKSDLKTSSWWKKLMFPHGWPQSSHRFSCRFQLSSRISVQSKFLKSFFSPGYLIRPSLLTGPSSDFGSGDKELHVVLEQDLKAGQEEVFEVHRSPITQEVPMRLSSHASRGRPTSWEFRWAVCRAGCWGGSFKTELSCWKLWSRYKLPGGPEWSQLSSSGRQKKMFK